MGLEVNGVLETNKNRFIRAPLYYIVKTLPSSFIGWHPEAFYDRVETNKWTHIDTTNKFRLKENNKDDNVLITFADERGLFWFKFLHDLVLLRDQEALVGELDLGTAVDLKAVQNLQSNIQLLKR